MPTWWPPHSKKGAEHEHTSTWMCFVFGERVSHFQARKHQCFDVSVLVNPLGGFHHVRGTLVGGRDLPSILAFAGNAALVSVVDS